MTVTVAISACGFKKACLLDVRLMVRDAPKDYVATIESHYFWDQFQNIFVIMNHSPIQIYKHKVVSMSLANSHCIPYILFNRWANTAHWPSCVGVPHSGYDWGLPSVWHEPFHEHCHLHQLLHQQLYPWDWTWVLSTPTVSCCDMLIQSSLHQTPILLKFIFLFSW